MNWYRCGVFYKCFNSQPFGWWNREYRFSLCAQEKLAVRTVADLATALPTVPNWRRYRTSRRRTSAARTIWRRVLQTGKTTRQTAADCADRNYRCRQKVGSQVSLSSYHV